LHDCVAIRILWRRDCLWLASRLRESLRPEWRAYCERYTRQNGESDDATVHDSSPFAVAWAAEQKRNLPFGPPTQAVIASNGANRNPPDTGLGGLALTDCLRATKVGYKKRKGMTSCTRVSSYHRCLHTAIVEAYP
jgi:hypothetical protein